MSNERTTKRERMMGSQSRLKLRHDHQLIVNIVGWYGMVAVLLAYGLVSLEILSSHSLVCILLNLTGSAGLVTAAFFKRAHQFVVINVVWGFVALVTLVQLLIA